MGGRTDNAGGAAHREQQDAQKMDQAKAWNRSDRSDRTQAATDGAGATRTPADWNRSPDVPVDQHAENQRVADSSDRFIGMPHGKSTRGDLKQQVLQILKGELSRNVGLLGGFSIQIEGTSSRTGNDRSNRRLADQRAENVKEAIQSLMQQNAVNMWPTEIRAVGKGEAPARDAGVPDGYDRAEDRGVRIRFILADHKTPPPDKPAQPENKDIPPGFQQGYTVDRPTAERLVDAPDKWGEKVKDIRLWKDLGNVPKQFKRLGEDAVRQMYETFRELSDGVNRWNDQCARSTPEDALWKVRPPYPLSTNKTFEPFKENVKYKLKQAGYEPSDRLYREYLIHWYRKGER